MCPVFVLSDGFLANGSEPLRGTTGRGDLSGMLTWEKPYCEPFRELMAHASITGYLEELLGPGFRVTKQRGRLVSSPLAERVVATVHPSSILRARDDPTRHAEMAAFIRDLRAVAKLLGQGA